MNSNSFYRQTLVELLRSRNATPGESVEVGWFCFRVCQGEYGIDLETLDFKEMASFTRNFDVVERIKTWQEHVLNQHGLEPVHCSLMQFANVDPTYEPGDPNFFMARISKPKPGDDYSGWVVGNRSRGLPFKDLRRYEAASLYEISIADERTLPFWLLPCEWSVVAENGQVVAVPPGHSDRYFATDYSLPPPWWKVWG